MANYNSWLVTAKPFKVKDDESFAEALEEVQVPEVENDYHGLHYRQNSNGTFWIGGYNADLVVYLPAGDSTTEVDVAEIVKEHIQKGETAVFQIVGQEKLRHVSGAVIVVTPYGIESRTLDDMAYKLEDEMDPLRQGVKESLSSEE